jgi:hypothetical protein
MEEEKKACDLLSYALKLEKFYSDLVDAMILNGSCLWAEGSEVEEFIDDHDLLVFEQSLNGMPYDDSNEKLLGLMVKKGYRIILNFQEPDIILGNIALKIDDKWFAFGQCKNDADEGSCVTQIWPLKYVIPRIQKMEVNPRYFQYLEPSQP